MYRSVPQIRPPSRISPPCIFSAKYCWGIFIPRISPPPPLSPRRRLTPQPGYEATVESLRFFYLSHSAGYRERRQPASTMDTPATSWKRPAFSPLNAASVGASLRLVHGDASRLASILHWQMIMGSCFIGREGVIAREIVASTRKHFMECCPRNGQQLELSCIYLLNGYIDNRRDPEILNEMSIVSLIPGPRPAFQSLQYGNIVVLLEWCESLSRWLNMIKPTIAKKWKLDRKLSSKNFILLLQSTETIYHRPISVISIW